MAINNQIQGSVLSFPLRPDRRGTLATESSRARIVEQSIMDFIETRKGEHKMKPEYGVRDFLFDVADIGFAERIAYDLEQVLYYEPLLQSIRTRVGSLNAQQQFVNSISVDPHRVAISVTYTVRGSNTPFNIVFPGWRLSSHG